MGIRTLPEPDRRTIESLKAGDHAAFRVIYDLYKNPIYNVAKNMLGNSYDASEATQQSFVKILRGIGSFELRSAFGTWLYRIVINVCYDVIRSRKKRSLFAEGDVAVEMNEDVHLVDTVQHAIQSLPPKVRSVIVLKYVEGLSYIEIAEALRCSKGTVGSRMNRGHDMLSKLLSDLRKEV